MTPTISLQSPLPFQNFATRHGRCQSDESGVITNVIYGSLLMQDLIGAGCTIVPTITATSLQDPVE